MTRTKDKLHTISTAPQFALWPDPEANDLPQVVEPEPTESDSDRSDPVSFGKASTSPPVSSASTGSTTSTITSIPPTYRIPDFSLLALIIQKLLEAEKETSFPTCSVTGFAIPLICEIKKETVRILVAYEDLLMQARYVFARQPGQNSVVALAVAGVKIAWAVIQRKEASISVSQLTDPNYVPPQESENPVTWSKPSVMGTTQATTSLKDMVTAVAKIIDDFKDSSASNDPPDNDGDDHNDNDKPTEAPPSPQVRTTRSRAHNDPKKAAEIRKYFLEAGVTDPTKPAK